jgi:hypothetical protein
LILILPLLLLLLAKILGELIFGRLGDEVISVLHSAGEREQSTLSP